MVENIGDRDFFGSQDFIFFVNSIFLTRTGMGYTIKQSFKKNTKNQKMAVKISNSKNGSQEISL